MWCVLVCEQDGLPCNGPGEICTEDGVCACQEGFVRETGDSGRCIEGNVDVTIVTTVDSQYLKPAI